jgi:hypothetical protein
MTAIIIDDKVLEEGRVLFQAHKTNKTAWTLWCLKYGQAIVEAWIRQLEGETQSDSVDKNPHNE